MIEGLQLHHGGNGLELPTRMQSGLQWQAGARKPIAREGGKPNHSADFVGLAPHEHELVADGPFPEQQS